MRFELTPTTFQSSVGTVNSAYLSLLIPSTQPAKPTRADVIYQALLDTLDKKGVPLSPSILCKHPEYKNHSSVKLSEWRNLAYSELAKDLPKQSSQQATFARCKNELLNIKKIS